MSALIAGVVVLALVMVFGFDRTRLARKLGELKGANDDLVRKVDLYEEALATLVAPDPSLDELERMSETAARARSAQLDLPILEPGGADRLLRPGSARKAGESDRG